MDFPQASGYATQQAQRLAGDLYPGPVLMPRGFLRALDPLLAVALGPAQQPSEAFRAALERTMKGRPDGPLLLALWSTLQAGEMPHGDFRELLDLLSTPLPCPPADREELLAELAPKCGSFGRCALAVLQRQDPEALQAAEDLGIGLCLTHLLVRLPSDLGRQRFYLPLNDLEASGLQPADLAQGLMTPKVRHWFVRECDWARHYLDLGLPLSHHIGARLRRGLRAMVLRARALLDQMEQGEVDCFRRPPALKLWTRWGLALRSLTSIQPITTALNSRSKPVENHERP
ncbi:MAG: hypothetical protein DWQ01_20930 [Planctomycetota bacterium]|nr:MAG: hypothetical protein DWQ01_20930 [Planctomycetota bacterium]